MHELTVKGSEANLHITEAQAYLQRRGLIMTQETTAVDTSNEQSLAAMSDADFLNTVAAQPTADTP